MFGRKRRRDKIASGLSLWIDQNQVKQFSGFPMEIFVIANGFISPYILDPNFEKYLPVIPAEVTSVNFTWKSSGLKYLYKFSKLKSFNREILDDPAISIGKEGKVPRRPKVFSVLLLCSGNVTGVASFGIGLMIKNRNGKRQRIAGMPLKLKLQKHCAKHSPDPECDKKCANGGKCNQEKLCECPEGYMGQYCSTALCYPQCMNGGTCISPGVCSCAEGYQGTHCEGGICREKCLNGGKCIQKDTCSCPKGYYGPRCEFSRCVPLCLNGGRCTSNNTCSCPKGYYGTACDQGKGTTLGSGRIPRKERTRLWV